MGPCIFVVKGKVLVTEEIYTKMAPQRRYICSFCARAFSRSEHRARHERSHTKEKPFQCDKCPSAFVRRDLLQRHLRTVHSKDKPECDNVKHEILETLPPLPALPEMTMPLNGQNYQRSSISSPPMSITASSSAATTPPRSPVASPHPTPKDTSIDGSQLYKFNEKNIISLLTLSKKFDRLRYLDLNSKISSFFLVWGTMSNLNLPIVKNDQIPSLDEHSSLLYALLSFGAADSNQFEDCIKLLNKSWVLILKFNANPLEIIQSLTILAHIYLIYYPTLMNLNGETKQDLIPIEIVMDYLDQTIISILKSSPQQEQLFNYWHVFLVLANFSLYYNKKPAGVHQLFLTMPLPHTSSAPEPQQPTLQQFIDSLSKVPSLPMDSDFASNCLIMGLSNELQALKFSQHSSLLSRDFLHNAIIMANKSFIVDQQAMEIRIHHPDEDHHDTMLENLLMISKRNLLLNCPLKFQDLIVDYITVPKTKHHWKLLDITLKEFNFDYSSSMHHILELKTPEDISVTALNHFNGLQINGINNNLGLVALPMLFIGYIGNSNLKSDLKTLLQMPSNYVIPIIETYFNLIKIFTSLNSSPEYLNNAIIQSIIYLISEMGTTTDSELQNEITSCLAHTPTQVSSSFIKYFSKNLELNFISWLSSTYSAPNKSELILGIQHALRHLIQMHTSASPLSSHPSSPHTFNTNLTPLSLNTFSTKTERIKLPPISFPPLSEPRMMLPVPTGLQQYRNW